MSIDDPDDDRGSWTKKSVKLGGPGGGALDHASRALQLISCT
jgi:hypothetical protein